MRLFHVLAALALGVIFLAPMPAAAQTIGQYIDNAGARQAVGIATPHPTANYSVAVTGQGWVYAAAAGGIVSSTAGVTMKAAPAAGLRNYVSSCQMSHDTLGGATEFAVRDGAAGTVIFRVKLQTAAQENLTWNFDQPLRGSAATLTEAAALTSVTGGIFFSCQGFVAP